MRARQSRLDVGGLDALIAACQQNYHFTPDSLEIYSVARPVVDAHFRNSLTYRLDVSGVARGKALNPDLDPQTSEGWDAGIEQDLFDETVRVGATYFEIDYEDLISFTPRAPGLPGTYANVNEAKSRGIEVFVAAKPTEKIRLRVDYTNLDNDDKSAGKALELRRPDHQVSATAGVQATEKLDITVYGVYVGPRMDISDARLDEYTLVNLVLSYDMSDTVEGYVRVENLLDEDYQQISTYGTAGIAAYAGVKAAF